MVLAKIWVCWVRGNADGLTKPSPAKGEAWVIRLVPSTNSRSGTTVPVPCA